MRTRSGIGYPHHNLNAGQREAIGRLDARLLGFTSGWTPVYLTDPLPEGRKGLTFYPRRRRTWTFTFRGYPVIRLYGRAVQE